VPPALGQSRIQPLSSYEVTAIFVATRKVRRTYSEIESPLDAQLKMFFKEKVIEQ